MDNPKRKRGRPKSFTPKESANIIQSLDRAIDVLKYVSNGDGKTLSEIAEALQQSPATIYRVLTTLAARDAVEIDPANQEWHIGSGSFRIGSAFLRRSGVVERARPLMRTLMMETGETANLAIENNGQVLFLSQVETHENIRAFFPPGTMSPMYASGIGKALLAYADPAKQQTYIDRVTFERFTDNTITTKQSLKTELDLIKTQGTAFDNEEKSHGMRCVAAPIFNSYGEVVAGISVSGPTARLSLDRVNEVRNLVKNQANILSLAMGYS